MLKVTKPASTLPGMKHRSLWHQNLDFSYYGSAEKNKANNRNLISVFEVSESMGQAKFCLERE